MTARDDLRTKRRRAARQRRWEAARPYQRTTGVSRRRQRARQHALAGSGRIQPVVISNPATPGIGAMNNA